MSDKPEEPLDVGEEELDLGVEEEQEKAISAEVKEGSATETTKASAGEEKHKKLERLQRLGLGIASGDESHLKKKKERQERFGIDDPVSKRRDREKRFGKVEEKDDTLHFENRRGRGRRNSAGRNKYRGRGGRNNFGGDAHNENKRKAEPVDAETAEKRRKRGERFSQK